MPEFLVAGVYEASLVRPSPGSPAHAFVLRLRSSMMFPNANKKCDANCSDS